MATTMNRGSTEIRGQATAPIEDTYASSAIELLVAQHRQMERLLKDLVEAASASERASLFGPCASELMSHVLVEEEIFYPAVKAERTEDVLFESLEEHLSLKRVLRDLVGLAFDNPHFEPKMHVLEEQVRHHHKEEEEHLFPKVEKIFSRDRLEALARTMRVRQAELRQCDARSLLAGQTKEAAELR
jgi:hemerythrin superfamily protein